MPLKVGDVVSYMGNKGTILELAPKDHAKIQFAKPLTEKALKKLRVDEASADSTLYRLAIVQLDGQGQEEE